MIGADKQLGVGLRVDELLSAGGGESANALLRFDVSARPSHHH